MKTDAEIIARLDLIVENDMFGFETTDLALRLPLEEALKFLNLEDPENYQPRPRDRDALVVEMKAYMPFAWDKANGGKGLSAGRSMSHYQAWLWLAGEDVESMDLLNYEFYGKDRLRDICLLLSMDPDKFDDGIREN
jgi:hypothetical protein